VVTVSWELHCNGTGDVSISAHATGTDEYKGTAVPATGDTVTVHQGAAAALNVTHVVASQETVSACQEFTITATVTNEGEVAALDVTAYVSIAPATGASVVSGPVPANILSLAGGTSQAFTWRLHCDAAGTVTITVTPSGIDENSGAAISDVTASSTTVTQQTKAHLVVTSIGTFHINGKHR